MQLFGGWLPYIGVCTFDLPGEGYCAALVVGWFMRFAFVGFIDGELTYGVAWPEKR